MSDISSPCVRNCCLDKKDVCIGCGRTVQEIILWGEAGDKQRLLILEVAKERRLAREELQKF